MKGFVDTTVLIHVVERTEPVTARTQAFVAKNGPAVLPDYALRELVAGKLRQLCDAHNRVLAADNPGEAVTAILASASFKPRAAAGSATAVAGALSTALSGTHPRTPADVKRETLQALMLQAGRFWRRAQQDSVFAHAQPLSCFAKGSLSPDPSTGALKGPNDSFNCAKKARCAAAVYMAQQPQDLDRLIAALHPQALGTMLSIKTENKSRRKALKELKNRGAAAFPKNYCRALGDAYFAAMCPPGSAVLTTNLVDHLLLCAALNKAAQEP